LQGFIPESVFSQSKGMLELVGSQMRVRDRHVGASSEALAELIHFAQQKRFDLLCKLLSLLLVVRPDKDEVGVRIVESAENGMATREHEADMCRLRSSIAGKQHAE
jgi:hypothetical protein